jgi:hypothetical protein
MKKGGINNIFEKQKQEKKSLRRKFSEKKVELKEKIEN